MTYVEEKIITGIFLILISFKNMNKLPLRSRKVVLKLPQPALVFPTGNTSAVKCPVKKELGKCSIVYPFGKLSGYQHLKDFEEVLQ